MGLDPERIPLLREAIGVEPWPLADAGPEAFAAVCNGVRTDVSSLAKSEWVRPFAPAMGWVGNIEGGGRKAET